MCIRDRDNLIYHCYLFLENNWLKENIPKELHIGTAGSMPWGKLLCALVIFNKGKVTNYEHGRGTILHYFVQVLKIVGIVFLRE